MVEDMGTGLLEDSHTKSGIPIEHLDYRYVEGCKNAKELEKILKVLRSGEEGVYPDLIEFTEERLKKVNPKSKSLRKENPIKTYHDLSASEEQEITDDLQEWMTSINQADKSLKKESQTGVIDNDNLPPVRSAASSEGFSSKLEKFQEAVDDCNRVLSAEPNNVKGTCMFDPDKEIESLEEKEKKERKKKLENAKVMSASSIPSNVDLRGKSETERQLLANKEKEKGNEAFQSGNYMEALAYYCRSIEMNPRATAVYNNRALAEIKLEKFQEAVDDCNRVLSAEPNNVKAYLRRSIAQRSQGLCEEATADLYKVLAIEPNNKRAKELLGEMKKNESEVERPSKSGESKDRRKQEHTSMENETTSTNINSYNKESTASRTKTKGKRLKIVEVDSENDSETTQHLNDNVCADKGDEVKQHIDITHHKDSNDVTAAMNGVNSHPAEGQPQVAKQPELPGLVIKAQVEGTRLFKLGSYAAAAEQFTQAIDILQKDKLLYHSSLCSLLCNRGSCLVRMGDCTGCVTDCTAALQLIPDAFRPLLKRAEAYETSEKFAKAWSDYQLALNVHPQHSGAQQGKLRVSRHLENLYGSKWREQVAPVSSSAASPPVVNGSLVHPSPTQSVNGVTSKPHLIPTQATSNQTNQSMVNPNSASSTTQSTPAGEAIGSTTASSTHPAPVKDRVFAESPSAVDPAVKFAQSKEKGNALVKQNLYDEAVACYTECIEIDPENVAVYTNRALCYLRLNQDELAIQDTTEALRLQPDNVKALFRRALAKKALNQYDSAARDLFQLQKIEPKNAAAKKELEVVLDLCRKERRESTEKGTKTKKTKKGKEKKEQQKPQVTQEEKPQKWRRITVKDVQYDDEDDEQPVSQEPMEQSSIRQPEKIPLNPSDRNTGKPVKLVKTTPYDFFQAWNSVKKGSYKDYADLLRQLDTKRLAKVLSNKLEAPMLSSIIAALSQEIAPQGEESLAFDILEQLTHVERFDMVLLFMSAKEKNELQQLFSKLQAARLKQDFVTNETFDRLKQKYKI
ncbi:unnamed protein product [Porites evermanni]|uniref:RNA-polymerase II-associated protein 3-like C-terminal domain-containing protein n=1 Tax=Porites evermanni TaxID=104178 RepID=A0ABN8SIL5_9CNID|nr:unnamed protein product [Porites evermanni]